MSEYPNLFEPGTIGEHTVRNRLVMPPMGTNYANETGGVTDRMVEYYAERARGGVGLIIVEVAAVEYPRGKAITRELSIADNKHIAGLSRLAEQIKNHGAGCYIQLHHAGRQTTTAETEGLEPVAPSPVKEEFLGTEPRALETSEVEDMVERFIAGAERAHDAGFDGVELHGAHGYLVGQFMSSRTNEREDRYGGDLEDRMTFPLEILGGIRDRLGDSFGLGVRISADEFVEGGNDVDDAKEAAKMIEEAGADFVHVSSGIYESMPTILEPMRYEEAWRTYLADEIGDVVEIPTIAVGSIRQPETAERVLEDGQADFVAIGRGLITDPRFLEKAREGREAEINRCIGCNLGCLGEGIFAGKLMGCTVNPEVGREREFAELGEAPHAQSVLVAGAGPGGAEAAIWASNRGHDVTVWEADDEIGGQLDLAAAPPGRGKIDWFREYLETQLENQDIDVRLGERVDRDLVVREDPDAVVVATGARPHTPDIEGVDREHVVHVWELLDDVPALEANSAVVVGAGQSGCEAAEFLAGKDVETRIVEMLDEIAPDMEPITRFDTLERYEESDHLAWDTGRRVSAIEESSIVAVDEDGTEHRYDADLVVLATGSEPNDELAEELADLDVDVYVVGDATKPTNILHAVEDGCEVGISIGTERPTYSPVF